MPFFSRFNLPLSCFLYCLSYFFFVYSYLYTLTININTYFVVVLSNLTLIFSIPCFLYCLSCTRKLRPRQILCLLALADKTDCVSVLNKKLQMFVPYLLFTTWMCIKCVCVCFTKTFPHYFSGFAQIKKMCLEIKTGAISYLETKEVFIINF